MSEMKKAVLVVTLNSVAFIPGRNKKPGGKSGGIKTGDVIADVSGTAINNAD